MEEGHRFHTRTAGSWVPAVLEPCTSLAQMSSSVQPGAASVKGEVPDPPRRFLGSSHL